jgi:hypothetical protein
MGEGSRSSARGRKDPGFPQEGVRIQEFCKRGEGSRSSDRGGEGSRSSARGGKDPGVLPEGGRI